MATYTTEYRDQLVAAITALTVGGVSSVSIAGQSVTALDLEKLEKHLEKVNAALAASSGGAWVYQRRFVPPGCG